MNLHNRSGQPSLNGPDYMTEDGALALVGKVVAYWRALGYEVEAWAEPVSYRQTRHHGRVAWCVRTNLLNALPRRMG